jgi:hypothetical protein
MLNVGDLSVILPACRSFRQLAKLEPEDSNDKGIMNHLVSFMENQKKVCAMFSGTLPSPTKLVGRSRPTFFRKERSGIYRDISVNYSRSLGYVHGTY